MFIMLIMSRLLYIYLMLYNERIQELWKNEFLIKGLMILISQL